MGIDVVGHRGASGYAPETTMESYRRAIRMGADWVEADVHQLRDGTLAAIHDADLKRTTNGKGWVGDLTLAELKALDAGSWFNKAFPDKARPEYIGLCVPTLQEIIDLVAESSAGLFIEIKDPERYAPDLESLLLATVRRSGMEKRTRFLSFSAQSLRKIKEFDDAIPTVFLISKPGRNPVKDTVEVPADELGIQYRSLTAEMVEAAHKQGVPVSVWTVDDRKDMLRMIEMGVDRITTNYPDRLLQVLGR